MNWRSQQNYPGRRGDPAREKYAPIKTLSLITNNEMDITTKIFPGMRDTQTHVPIKTLMTNRKHD